MLDKKNESYIYNTHINHNTKTKTKKYLKQTRKIDFLGTELCAKQVLSVKSAFLSSALKTSLAKRSIIVLLFSIERERGGGGGETDRQTDRHRDTDKDRHRDREGQRETETEAERKRERHTKTQRHRETQRDRGNSNSKTLFSKDFSLVSFRRV